MRTEERREEIIQILKNSSAPRPAKYFANVFDVSRQVIVQDMAVIKAFMPEIIATNRGYILKNMGVCTREFKLRHTEEQTAEELNLIVDRGGIVKNVSISHAVYGRISADMDIRSRQDAREFVDKLKSSKSTILGSATSGYHYHLVEAQSERRLDIIEQALKDAGFIVPYQPWEIRK